MPLKKVVLACIIIVQKEIGGKYMGFHPGFYIGQEVTNADIVTTFKCGNMGGMRRSHETNTLVIVSDYTKGPYFDYWIGDVLHYTGMGKRGNQVLYGNQNKTLFESDENGVDVHLFEVVNEGVYIYCGEVELADKPYKGVQPDEDGRNRIVWVFPVKLVSNTSIVKPTLYTYSTMEEYENSGNAIDTKRVGEYEDDTTQPSKNVTRTKPVVTKEKIIKHKTYGIGTVLKLQDNTIYIKFESGETRQLNYKLCVDNKIIEFI